jgi:hypothetical protein
MTESPNDAFARLKNRPRAAVPPRSKSLTDNSNDKKTEFSHSVIDKFSQDQIELILNHGEQTVEMIRRTIRLDPDIDIELDQLCRHSKITRETFLEAAYLACIKNPDLLGSILAEAQERYHQRKQVGEQRKLETMNNRQNLREI